MSDRIVAIDVDNVSKTFKRHSEPAKTFKERVLSWHKSEVKKFGAVNNVDFDVEVGESIGILGHNGSGKSTLLKMIAGTLRPSVGTVKVRGRLAALLELGAGFHPDLTGAENVYLNGSVLGFSKDQIDDIFDEIVDFAELEEFIHSQVKHYSSGMYARLGFAVAINLQPDILLVDEVLAVGDEAFQRKCIARINQFQQRGKTLMLVTHSPEQVVDLCDRAIVLDHGNVLHVGDVNEAVEVYRRSIHGETYDELNLVDNNIASTHCITVVKSDLESTINSDVVRSGEWVKFSLSLKSEKAVTGNARLLLHDHENHEVMNLSTGLLLGTDITIPEGGSMICFKVAQLPLPNGVYTASLVVNDVAQDTVYACIEKILKFTVENERPDTGRVAADVSVEIFNE